MPEPTEALNVMVPRSLKRALEKAQVVKGRPEYSLAAVTRIVLARAISANMHLHLEEAPAEGEAADVDAGEEASS